MPYDEGLAELLRNNLADMPDIAEKRVFGGLCFMKDGHMLCGVHKGGGMFRVGKGRQTAALAVEGAAPLAFTGRRIGRPRRRHRRGHGRRHAPEPAHGARAAERCGVGAENLTWLTGRPRSEIPRQTCRINPGSAEGQIAFERPVTSLGEI